MLVKQGATLIHDSGIICDSTFAGGRLGVFVYDQPDVIWSKMKVKCTDRYLPTFLIFCMVSKLTNHDSTFRENKALYFDGINDYVQLPSVENYRIQDSFTLEVWYKPSNEFSSNVKPIICTQNSMSFCLYIQNR